jgi:nucleoid-associated protein YgaU
VAVVLRVTRLHLFIVAIGILCLSTGGFFWMKQHVIAPINPPLAQSQPPKVDMTEKLHQEAARALASVGEIYKPLCKRFGDVPEIAQPLRAGKQSLAQGESAKALSLARAAWLALKDFRQKSDAASQPYHVARGDTLWTIAEKHSPVKAGVGWVTIWKANKMQIENFDRIEIGWTLTIPSQRAEYVMPFWKPR